ncbi:MAG: hypothetical protein QNJ84_18760 [Alphaproteobacteria bacterium]|nr:hypothetical protein [Alphaproteobacteria bacterium]
MKLSLAPSFEPVKAPGSVTSGPPLLDPNGPFAILGWSETDLAAPISPARSTLFGPRGVCLHPNGSLWVCDTGHHRLLGWRKTPAEDNQPADILIGQPDFDREGRNAKGTPSAVTLNVPTGVCAWGDGLAVADAWNHRVLLWRQVPTEPNQPADIILGQVEADGVLANRGADAPTAATLNWCYGVAQVDGMLAVADTGNRRVLLWEDVRETGQPADRVLGQHDFTTRDENAGVAVGALGMRWPHGIAVWRGKLAVSDAGDNRIMLWDSIPDRLGAPCDAVIGQAGFDDCDHNQAAYYPSAAAVNMPYGIAACDDVLVTADTANSRLIGWTEQDTGAPASRLTGQPDFASKGDNRWGMPVRDSLCWPYGLSLRDRTVAVADSGNNRVMLWDLAT